MSKIKVMNESANDVMQRAQFDIIKDNDELRAELREMAEYLVEVDEDGHEDIDMANYATFCDNVANRYINLAMEELECDDLGAVEVKDMIDQLSALLSYSFEKYYIELVQNAKEKE